MVKGKLIIIGWFILLFILWAIPFVDIIANKHNKEKKSSSVCYVDQQVKEETIPPNLPKFKITTKIYIENDTCYFLVATWEDIATEESLQEKKENRLNQANDLRFETNMGIITGRINICK